MATITERLARNPAFQQRVEDILDLMEASGDELKRADEAERQITEMIRQLGHDALSGWAGQRVDREASQGEANSDWRSAGKKTLLA